MMEIACIAAPFILAIFAILCLDDIDDDDSAAIIDEALRKKPNWEKIKDIADRRIKS